MSDQETLTARVGRRLRAARLQAGMTVREATTATGIAHSMIVKYENGTIAPPLNRIEALARAYKIAPAALFATHDAAVDTLSTIDQADVRTIEQIANALQTIKR